MRCGNGEYCTDIHSLKLLILDVCEIDRYLAYACLLYKFALKWQSNIGKITGGDTFMLHAQDGVSGLDLSCLQNKLLTQFLHWYTKNPDCTKGFFSHDRLSMVSGHFQSKSAHEPLKCLLVSEESPHTWISCSIKTRPDVLIWASQSRPRFLSLATLQRCCRCDGTGKEPLQQ